MGDEQLNPHISVHSDTTPTTTLDPELLDFDPLPRGRLNADSRPVGTLDPEPIIPRQRSNASSYSENPRSRAGSRSSSAGLISQSGDVTVTSPAGTPPNLAVPLTSSPCGSTASADDVKVIVEANDDIIQDTPVMPVISPPDLITAGAVNGTLHLEESLGSGNSEPEPGASFEPAVNRTNSLELRLEVPEDSGDDVPSLNVPETDTKDLEASEDNGIQEYPPEWYTDQKHVFIFSEAGKPIFSRHGKEECIVGLFGVMQALLSCVQDTRDDLRCIRTADRMLVFRCHSPLVLVCVAGVEESEDQLARQLKYVANQAVFFLTQSHMARLFKNRQSYDLRHQMTGLPKFIKGIIRFVEEEHSFLLESIRCLAMPQSLRNEITSILLANRCPELVFAIVLYERQIVSIVRPKQYALTPQDIHLLMNYVQTGSTRGHGEKWTPACLPDFNDGGFLYIHDSYIHESRDVSLVLITNEREQHLNMIKCKMRIVEQMTSQNTLGKLDAVLQAPFCCSDSKIPDLRHFIYKSKSSQQIVSPEYTAPYNSDDDRKRLYLKYCHVYDKLHHSDSKLSIYFDVDSRESVIGYLMNNSEIYCTFSPYATRPVALNNVDKLLKWIRREENRFFILGLGVY